ncbi:hypothetical protein BDZ94DRAFT_1272550 [Collybia nuda]|uniref:Uncharacterized protein n=1 Tax=Collybia nuda TaxID=64659 RepID=A0A9P5XY06_9AGAR|nr:hypothetical protein BDZ94DRAFT_1272550 [Collybia nuda]
MAISLPVPQDIISEIIDKLGNNPDALKACARVARSFLIPSRKKLFSAIRLTTRSARRLLFVLQRNPDISDYILDVTIVTFSLANTNLLHILKSLDYLQHLAIELQAHKPPPIHQPLFGNLLSSPKYATLSINGTVVLPSSLINSLRVKKMRLHGVMVRNSRETEEEDVGEPSRLETLDLLVWSIPDQRLEPLRLFQNVFGLRELGIRMKWGYEKTISLGRVIITRSSRSIEHVALYYDSRSYITPDLELGLISNLRFLSFTLQYFFSETEEPDKFKFDWESTLDILNDSHVTRNLEELSLVIEFRPAGMHFEVIRGLCAWSDLDNIFVSSAPKLRKLNLYVDGGSFDNLMGDEKLRIILDDKFSSLHKKGVIVSYRSCRSSTLDLRRW